MKSIVYADMLFLINFLMDSVVFYTTSKVLKRNIHILRLATVSGVAALYSSVMFFPQLSLLYTFIFKVLFTVAAVWIAFPVKNVFLLLKSTAVFFVISAVFSGTAFFLIFATDFGTAVGAAVSNGEIYFNLSMPLLLAATVSAYCGIYTFSRTNRKNIRRSRYIADAAIELGEKQIRLRALCDTGCSLCDPISGAPAIIIDKRYAEKILSDSLMDFIKHPESCADCADFSDIYRVLPLKTVAARHGLIHGFVPARLTIDGKTVIRSVVGISEGNVSADSAFDAIFNPSLIENENIKNFTEVDTDVKQKASFI